MSLWAPGWTWIYQWPEWFKWSEYNWLNFDLIQISVEAGAYKGRYIEVMIVVFGLGFLAELYEKDSRDIFAEEMHRRVSEVEDGNYVTLETCTECDGHGTKWKEAEQ